MAEIYLQFGTAFCSCLRVATGNRTGYYTGLFQVADYKTILDVEVLDLFSSFIVNDPAITKHAIYIEKDRFDVRRLFDLLFRVLG